MSTISGKIVIGVTLGTAGYTSPLTITSTGYIDSFIGSYNGVYATYANPVVINHGRVSTATRSGIEFTDGGSVYNGGNTTLGPALITGFAGGVYMYGAAGTVTNAALIVGQNGVGIRLAAGGTV